MRVYAPEPLSGTPIDFKKNAVLRQHIGKQVEYTERGWCTKRTGQLQAVVGQNFMVDGDWKFRTSILAMTVKDEATA